MFYDSPTIFHQTIVVYDISNLLNRLSKVWMNKKKRKGYNNLNERKSPNFFCAKTQMDSSESCKIRG